MPLYLEYHVNLSEGQKANLAKAIKTWSKITLRLKNSQLKGSDETMLTKTQVNKIRKAMDNGTGIDIKISKTQIRKSVIQGGSLWSSLTTLGAKALPYVTKAASKALPALATGAVSALGSLGVDKIFGKGVQTGGFLIPQNKIYQLIKHKGWLSEAQKKTDFISTSYRGATRDKANEKTTGRIWGFSSCKYWYSFSTRNGIKTFWKRFNCSEKSSRSWIKYAENRPWISSGPKTWFDGSLSTSTILRPMGTWR